MNNSVKKLLLSLALLTTGAGAVLLGDSWLPIFGLCLVTLSESLVERRWPEAKTVIIMCLVGVYLGISNGGGATFTTKNLGWVSLLTMALVWLWCAFRVVRRWQSEQKLA